MKPILAFLAGFALTSMVFTSGVAATVYLIMPEPVHEFEADTNMTALWSAHPSPVETPADAVAAEPATPVVSAAADTTAATAIMASTTSPAADTLDLTASASIEAPANELASETAGQLSPAHIEWCSRKFRSYRPETDSYTPYSGGSRPCVSPYSNGSGA